MSLPSQCLCPEGKRWLDGSIQHNNFEGELYPNPINTFHVGFWFNDPNDANVDGCVFDVTHPTPFNGEHKAGPLAMISVPNETTNLGPLCTDPTSDGTCNP